MYQPLYIGGNLSVETLISAYRNGIFPWYTEGLPKWYFPNPRMLLPLENFHMPRSLRRAIKQNKEILSFSTDHAFDDVIDNCARVHSEREGTWIHADMQEAYKKLHRAGVAHSVETWLNGELVGGIYGVAVGRIFSGESMFYFKPNASKMALAALVLLLREKEFRMLDCQVYTENTARFGAFEIPASDYQKMVLENQNEPDPAWGKEDLFPNFSLL